MSDQILELGPSQINTGNEATKLLIDYACNQDQVFLNGANPEWTITPRFNLIGFFTLLKSFVV